MEIWKSLKWEIRRCGFRVCPKILVRRDFEKAMGYSPDLEHPQTFNEKIQWLKFHYRDPLWCVCADKFAVRKYVIKKLGGGRTSNPSIWRMVIS